MKKFFFIASMGDVKYFNTFRSSVAGIATAILCEDQIVSFAHLKLLLNHKGIDKVATTSMAVLRYFYPLVEGTATENTGAQYTRDGITVTLLPPLKSLHTQNAGTFLLKHYTRKLIQPELVSVRKGPFSYTTITPSNLEVIFQVLDAALLVAVDIETMREPVRMTSIAYTAMMRDGAVVSYQLPHTPDNYPFCMDAMRKLNTSAAPKIMQNGMYDSLYFITFNAPLYNYVYDTYNLMHSLFPELPKTLHFISSMFIQNYTFWKDESSSDLYGYNAKDTHNTLYAFLGLLHYISRTQDTYAYTNYAEEFSSIWPALSCDCEGLLIDEAEQERLRTTAEEKLEQYRTQLTALLGQPLNANSPKQVKQVIEAIIQQKIDSTDDKTLKAIQYKFPLVTRIVTAVLNIRKQVKAIGTYFTVTLKDGRMFYHLDPGGTDTGRFASKASSYWCGTQVQNIPAYARSAYVFEDGWKGGAVDKSQAESYCTGYIAQDQGLQDAVNNSPDFHSHNASMFFARPFNTIYDADYVCPKTGEKGQTINKPLRTLSKRVNHGANYNMGPEVLLQTMGIPNVQEAKRLLGLPQYMTLIGVCKFLLARFDAVYPRVRGAFQRELIAEINRTGHILYPTGWTRRTFLRPSKSKLDLNTAVATKPQGTSAHLVNKAFRRVFWKLQHKKYPSSFRIKMQVHDEIVFIARPEVFEEAIELVREMMIIPLVIHGKLMKIPSSRAEGYRWSDLKD